MNPAAWVERHSRQLQQWRGAIQQELEKLDSARSIDDNEAGLTMPRLWPPFKDAPVSKTLDDLKRLKEEIMPKVEAM